MLERKVLLGATMLSAFGATQSVASPRKINLVSQPNIVVIMADDLLTSELSCYGGENLKTPNIDWLASEGVRFRRGYASMAVSVPIRASLYTGLYPARHGSYQNHRHSYDDIKSVNDHMPKLGYRVARTGKRDTAPVSTYKFNDIKGFTVGCTSPKAAYTLDGIRDFVNQSDNPFLLYVCSINPHVPWSWGDASEFDPNEIKLPDFVVDTPKMREYYADYLAEIRALDNEVGDVVNMLRKSGKLDNTIIMFLGEQGAQMPHAKWTQWEPGLNSAVIARYPSKIKRGVVSDAIIQYEDILPTFVDIAGGDCDKIDFDGVSFKKTLFGEKETHRKYAYGIHNNIDDGEAYPIRSIRSDKYTLIWNINHKQTFLIRHLMGNATTPVGKVWKEWEAKCDNGDQYTIDLMERYMHRPEYEFYIYERGVMERDNKISDPKYKPIIDELKIELVKWMKQQGDTGIAMDVPFDRQM